MLSQVLLVIFRNVNELMTFFVTEREMMTYRYIERQRFTNCIHSQVVYSWISYKDASVSHKAALINHHKLEKLLLKLS